jgi:hypothetical protein
MRVNAASSSGCRPLHPACLAEAIPVGRHPRCGTLEKGCAHLLLSKQAKLPQAGRARGRRVDTGFRRRTAMKKNGLARLAFAGATAAALTFGATQALAAPAASESTARACTDEYCRNVVCYPFPGVCQRGKCLCAG